MYLAYLGQKTIEIKDDWVLLPKEKEKGLMEESHNHVYVSLTLSVL